MEINGRFREGDVVRHFKGNHYEVIGLAKHTEKGEMLIIYKSIDGINKGITYARPFAMFNSKVDKKKYKECSQEYRFEVV